MRVLNIVTSGLRREGITQTQLNYLRHINSQQPERIDFDVLAVHDNAPDVIKEFESFGCRVIILPDRKRHVWAYIRKLYHLMKREQYDILHVHGSGALMSIELFIGRLAGIRVRIAHNHNTKADHARTDRLLRPVFYRLYTDAFACGRDAGERLYRGRAFRVIPNGLEIDRYQYDPAMREEVRRRYGWERKTVLGHVGNFNYQKNQLFLIELLERLDEPDREYALCLVGDGEEFAEVQNEVRRRHLTDRVVFTGRVSNVPELLQGMDLMLLPSRFEGLPNVVLEWQAAGLPCIVSDAVTGECAVTDLVTYLPLEPQQGWIDRIHAFCPSDRAVDSARGRERLIEAGLDICQNAGELRERYFDLAGYGKMVTETDRKGGAEA